PRSLRTAASRTATRAPRRRRSATGGSAEPRSPRASSRRPDQRVEALAHHGRSELVLVAAPRGIAQAVAERRVAGQSREAGRVQPRIVLGPDDAAVADGL